MFPLNPTYFIDGTIENLSPSRLKEDGIKGLILDLDNTIMRPRAGYFCETVLKWLQETKDVGLKTIVVTNNTNDEYIEKVGPILGNHQLGMIAKAAKPKKENLSKALELLELTPKEVCIVGDRVLTDVLGGVRLNMNTAYVRPLLGKEENLAFRFLREVELLLLNKKKQVASLRFL